jgi:glycosyltransferase involved in cell wall biosynthesis
MANNYDLSVLIPSRNEQFLKNTVEGLLANKRGKTEVIIHLDGEWANPPLPDHPDLKIIYSPEAIGQRAGANKACKLSKAKYVMKLDAHCAVDEGFDVKLMADMQDNWTVVPTLYNLHAFDWKCKKCGNRWYQGAKPIKCQKSNTDGNRPEHINEACDSTEFEQVIVFKPRLHRKSDYYRFDDTLHFQYWRAFANRPEAQGQIVDIMSIQGSCFMMTRERYLELNICDEAMGSWGQQGVEVALKTWLSGGRLATNKKTSRIRKTNVKRYLA